MLTTKRSVNLYVANLPSRCGKGDLVALFSPYGEVLTAKVMIDLRTGAAKDFGFVRLDGEASAIAAAMSLDGRNYKGKKLIVKETTSVEKFGEPSNAIFVRGIKISTSKRVVREYFEKFGTVLDIHARRDKSKPRGFDVTFETVEMAENALKSCNNAKYKGEKYPMFIVFTIPRSKSGESSPPNSSSSTPTTSSSSSPTSSPSKDDHEEDGGSIKLIFDPILPRDDWSNYLDE